MGLCLLFVVGWKQDMAIKALMRLMKDSVILFFSLSMEFLDIASDFTVFLSIIGDGVLMKYLPFYALCFGAGTITFLCHTFVSGVYLLRMFSELNPTSMDMLTASVIKRSKKQIRYSSNARVAAASSKAA